MKNKIQSILSFFSLLLILSTSCKAQTIKARKLVKNTDAALNSIETKIFRIDRKVMPFSKSDTIQTTAICSLKVNREDIVAAAYHKIDVLGAKNNYTFTKYDGNNLLISRSTLDSLSYPSKTHIINKEDNNFLSYIYGFDDYLIMGHYETKRPFRQMNSLIAKLFYIKKVNVEEAIHNGTPVYILSISTRNRKNFMEDAVMHHYIRKSDFLPIAYSFSGYFENIEEYEYYEIEYLNINSNIPLEHFTVHEEDQQLILKDLYKDFTERLNQ